MKNRPAINLASVIILEDITKCSNNFLKKSVESLEDSEKHRFIKIKSFERQQQFVISRFLIQQIIMKKLAIAITLNSSPKGKPYIPGWLIDCNISHSGNTVAAAFSTYSEIGIDIEIHRKRNFKKLVKNYFHPDETQTFNKLEESDTLDWFYIHWTAKEAMAKAKKEGIFDGQNLSNKIDSNKNFVLQKYVSRNSYFLSCVHYSEAPIELEIVTPLDYAPWIDLTVQTWS